MNQTITAFIDGLILHDYILFGSSVLLFILLLTLAIILRKKTVIAFFLIFSSFGILILGPSLGYIKLHEWLFSNDTALKEYRALEFTDALVVWGDINNTSKRNFTECAITAEVYKVSHNAILDAIYPLNPFKKMTIVVEDIPVGYSSPFKIIVEPFTYSREYNVSVGAKCR